MRFYVCKHCKRKIHVMQIATHTLENHIDKNYEIVDYGSQTVFELKNDELGTKIELTEKEANEKYNFVSK